MPIKALAFIASMSILHVRRRFHENAQNFVINYGGIVILDWM
jgi:hypothetical protein